jgi:hypothetical protein
VSGSSATIPGTLLDLPPDGRTDLCDPEKATDSSRQNKRKVQWSTASSHGL